MCRNSRVRYSFTYTTHDTSFFGAALLNRISKYKHTRLRTNCSRLHSFRAHTWLLLCVSPAVGIPRYQSHSSVCDRKDFVLNFNGISSFHPSAGGSYYHHHHHHHPQSVCQDIKPCVMWARLALWTARGREATVQAARPSHENKPCGHFWRFNSYLYFFCFVVVCLFEGFLPGCIVLPSLTRLPPSRNPKIFILFYFFCFFFLFGCTWENYAMKEMNEETPEAFKQTTLPIRTLTSVFFRNTTYDAFAHVTRANKNIFYVTMFFPIRVTTHMTLCANVNCKEPCTYCITPC